MISNGLHTERSLKELGFTHITGHRDIGLAFSVYSRRNPTGSHAHIGVMDDNTGWTTFVVVTANDAARTVRTLRRPPGDQT